LGLVKAHSFPYGPNETNHDPRLPPRTLLRCQTACDHSATRRATGKELSTSAIGKVPFGRSVSPVKTLRQPLRDGSGRRKIVSCQTARPSGNTFGATSRTRNRGTTTRERSVPD